MSGGFCYLAAQWELKRCEVSHLKEVGACVINVHTVAWRLFKHIDDVLSKEPISRRPESKNHQSKHLRSVETV